MKVPEAITQFYRKFRIVAREIFPDNRVLTADQEYKRFKIYEDGPLVEREPAVPAHAFNMAGKRASDDDGMLGNLCGALDRSSTDRLFLYKMSPDGPFNAVNVPEDSVPTTEWIDGEMRWGDRNRAVWMAIARKEGIPFSDIEHGLNFEPVSPGIQTLKAAIAEVGRAYRFIPKEQMLRQHASTELSITLSSRGRTTLRDLLREASKPRFS